jgi:hypothetical protein
MRFAILTVIATGCGSHASPAAPPPPAAAALTAARWVPAAPTYLLSSPALGDAQRSLRDAIDLIDLPDLIAALRGSDLRDATRAVAGLLGVDALHADPLAAIGVDLRGSWAVFSDELNPTAVFHLSAPELMTAFLDRKRDRGLVTESVIVDGIEVFSVKPTGGVARISWAVAGDWMWLHLGLSQDDGVRWFQVSHAPHAAAWTADWGWAQRAAGAAGAVVGLLGHGSLEAMLQQLPSAVACGRLAGSVGRVAVSLDGDGHQLSVRLAVDIGSTAQLRELILPPPSGWDATSRHAPLAVQWNLDLAHVRSLAATRFAPCLALAGGALAALDETGIRAARGVVLGFDPAAMSGSGALAFDITSAAFFERQLDRIPLRRAIERTRTFGGHRGARISIPFSVTLEYILEPTLAIVGIGDGVIDKLVAPGPVGPAPIFALDVAPPAMSAESWEAVFHALAEQQLTGAPSSTIQRIVQHLLRWRAARLAVTAEPTALVVTVTGSRR